MFGTIRKHQTWLWAVIITLTVISFVIWFSPYSRFNSGRNMGSAYRGSIGGHKISEDEYIDTLREVNLLYFFRTGAMPDEQEARKSGFDVMRETYYRLLLIHKINEMGIHASSEAVAEVARDMLRPPQNSRINSPAAFVKEYLEPHGFTMDDVERFVRHEVGVRELVATVALGGKLVTPQEAQSLYEREHQELSADAVFFSASNYLANVSATPEAIAMYYTNNLAGYRIPERMQVKYVEYPLTNFVAEADAEMAKATNLNERIEQVYQQRGTNYYKDVKSPEEAKNKIREEARKEFMTIAAQKRAAAFANELLDIKEPRLEDFNTRAASNSLMVRVTAPFDREEGPKDLHVGLNFAKRAFALSPTNEPFAGPLLGEDALYVICFDKLLPSEIPPLDQIRDRVTADYKYSQAKMLARQAGQAFYATLTNGLAAGKDFSAICTEAKVTPVDLPPFSLSTRSLPEVDVHIPVNQLKQLAFSTNPGKASEFQTTVEGGAIVYVKSKLPIDEAKMKSDLPNYVAYVRQTRQNEAFNEWFRKQAERNLQDTPLGWAKPTPAMSSAAAAKS